MAWASPGSTPAVAAAIAAIVPANSAPINSLWRCSSACSRFYFSSFKPLSCCFMSSRTRLAQHQPSVAYFAVPPSRLRAGAPWPPGGGTLTRPGRSVGRFHGWPTSIHQLRACTGTDAIIASPPSGPPAGPDGIRPSHRHTCFAVAPAMPAAGCSWVISYCT
jgi:hypothetical protein